MNSTVETRREIDLFQSLGGEWLKLPIRVMRQSGPAVQTFAGLLKVTQKETFVPSASIARCARLPLKTVRKQLLRLAADAWIINAGRQRTRAGVLRRTATLKLTPEGQESLSDFGVLPWWACEQINHGQYLHWPAKAVLAIIMSRLMSMNAAAKDQPVIDASDPWLVIDYFGGSDRFHFSLSYLERRTGLSRESIVRAKRELANCKIIQWQGDKAEDGGFNAHILLPNENFRMIVTRASNGGVYLRCKEVRVEPAT